MLTGWQTVKGKRYFFNKKTGCMHTGWLRTASGNMYYFFHDGVIRPGFQTVQGKIRYFNSNGLMIRNKIVTHKGKGIIWTKTDTGRQVGEIGKETGMLLTEKQEYSSAMPFIQLLMAPDIMQAADILCKRLL